MIKRLLVLPVVAAMGLAAVVAYGAWNGGGEHTATSASAVPSEGIDVHGNWHVSIYNQDGTLDREYAFENALRPGAGTFLGQALNNLKPDGSHSATVLYWTVGFGELDGTRTLNGDPLPGLAPCSVFADDVSNSNTSFTRGCFLTDDPTHNGEPGFGPLSEASIDGGIRLSGSVAATQAGSVNYVETQLMIAHETGLVDGSAFTGTDVGPFENIEAGQIIQVQVDITFATPAP